MRCAREGRRGCGPRASILECIYPPPPRLERLGVVHASCCWRRRPGLCWIFGLGCCCWATGITAPQPPAHPAPATPPPKNLIGVLFYFHTVNWKWNGEAVFLCAPSCREHSARYKMYLGQRLAETLGVLTETDGGAGHSDGRGSPGEIRANALCSRD